MSFSSSLKHRAKIVRHQWRRAAAGSKWGREQLAVSPIVFGNAMPKSGSHLLTQVLYGLTQIGPFVNPGFPPVNRDEANQPLPPERMIIDLQAMQPGEIRYGYIHAREPYLNLLTAEGRATFFLYRDPRDMLVSHVFYATNMVEEHGMHEYYNRKLISTEERINAAITGVTEPGYELASVTQRYESYMGWLGRPEVCCLRFEDLVLKREETLLLMLENLIQHGAVFSVGLEKAVEILAAGIAPRKSGTFRKGQPGNWREHFTENNIQRFKEVAPGLLVQLGYETSEDWSLEN